MTTRIIAAIVAVFVAWTAMDYVIHAVWLMPTYEETANLWRGPGQMKGYVLHLVTFIAAATFVLIYALFFARHTLRDGLLYGLLFGIGAGASMGYGSYAVMPLPYFLAQAWFWATVAETVVGGLIAALIVKAPTTAWGD